MCLDATNFPNLEAGEDPDFGDDGAAGAGAGCR